MSSGWGNAMSSMIQDAMQNKAMLYNIGMTAWGNATSKKEGDNQYIRTRDLMRAQQNWQEQMQQKTWDWTERMLNTAHQREVEDLKKAGLNPILSSGGTGAGSQAGVIGEGGTPSIPLNTQRAETIMRGAELQMQNRAVKVQEANQKVEQAVAQQKIATMQSEAGLNGAKQQLALAEKMNTEADTILKNKNASWFDRMRAQELKESASRIQMNSSSSLKMMSDIDLNANISALKQQEQLESQSRTWRNYNESIGNDNWGFNIGPVKFNEGHSRYGQRPKGGSGIN